ncbi:hypothetical protein TEA_025071 [Camellia sinensis var. sinensis]|uniref:Aldehyde oxidase/xanthine dehydrogenase a/b hammerhead domain-containing protein n=1 Tax=Camellia sinensis var. sinensis TaxID=542762 RepID=A0A4S4EZI7_CAMSN|nr:hypothetical protein TEA_025071 [Camellia sinensis var. sinensis]
MLPHSHKEIQLSLMVTGEAEYTDDTPMPPAGLHGALILSQKPHARILSIDDSGAKSSPGFAGIFFAKDVPGDNMIGPVISDEELFATEFVTCVGQAIGVVVADTYQHAKLAARKVHIQYEELPAILSIEDAVKCNSFHPNTERPSLPQLHQQTLLRPPPGLSMPPSMQQPMQYSGFNAPFPTGASNLPGSNLPEYPSPLLPVTTNSLNLAPTSFPASTLPSMLPPAPSITLAPEALPSSITNKAPSAALPTATLNANLPSLSPLVTSNPDTNAVIPPISNKTNAISGPTLPYQTISQPISSIVGSLGTSSSSQTETPTPLLVTPGQLLQSVPAAVSSSQSSQTAHKDVEVVQVSSSEPSVPVPVPTETQHTTQGGV